MKNIVMSAAIVAMTLFALPALASENCTGDTCMDMPDLTINNAIQVDFTTLGATAGLGEVTGLGAEFAGRVDRESMLTLSTELDVSSDGCDRNCGDIDLSFEGIALESISSLGVAVGTTPGESVGVAGASQALSQMGLNLTISDFSVETGGGG